MGASDIPIENLVEYCDSLARELMKDHQKRFGERNRAVSEASATLANNAGRFGSSVKNAWGSMDKSASEYGMRLAQTVQETASRIAQSQPPPKFSDTEKFHEESVQALNKIILTVRRYVPKLHKGLKTEMTALNTALSKLENAVRSLGEALDGSPGTHIEALRRDAAMLLQWQNELQKLRQELAEVKGSLAATSQREEELMRRREDLTSQAEFQELSRYQKSLESADNDIRQFFQPIVKPLVKLERAASFKQVPDVDTRTLRGLVETPVETLTTGQSFAIVQLLRQLDEALERGKLDIEERKRRKAQETIQQVKDGATDALRDEYLTIQANIQETLRQARAKGLLEKRDEVEELLSQVRREGGSGSRIQQPAKKN